MARQTRTQTEINQVDQDFDVFFLPGGAVSLNLEEYTTYGTTDPDVDLSMVNVRFLKDTTNFRGTWQADPESLGQDNPYVNDDATGIGNTIVLGSDNHFYQLTAGGDASIDPTTAGQTAWDLLSQQDELGASPFRQTDRYSAGNLVYRASNAGDGTVSLTDGNAGLLYVYTNMDSANQNRLGSQASLPGTDSVSNTFWRQVGGSGLTVLDTTSTEHSGINRLEPTHGIQINVTDQTATIGYGVPPHDLMENYVAGNLVRDTNGQIFEARGDIENSEPLTDTASWLQLSTGSSVGNAYTMLSDGTNTATAGVSDTINVAVENGITAEVTPDTDTLTIGRDAIPSGVQGVGIRQVTLGVDNQPQVVLNGGTRISVDRTSATGTPVVEISHTGPTITTTTIANKEPGFGETAGLSEYTYDSTGHIDTESNTGITIPNATFSKETAQGADDAARGLVEGPDFSTDDTRFLREDGTWVVPTDNNDNTTYNLQTRVNTAVPNSVDVQLLGSDNTSPSVRLLGAGGLTIAGRTTSSPDLITLTAPDRALDDLTDVDTSTTVPTNEQILRYDGANWIPSDEVDADATDTRIPAWTLVTGGRPTNYVTRVGSRLFYSNTDANVTNPFELISLSPTIPTLDANNLVITLVNAHATHPDNDPDEPHYTYSLTFDVGDDRHVATFRGRDVVYDRNAAPTVWTIPRSAITFTPTYTGNTIDATPALEFSANSDQWMPLGGGTGTTVSSGSADVNLGIYEDNIQVTGSGDNLNFLGMMTAFSSLNNGRGIRGVNFNTALGGRYEIDFRPPLPPVSASVSPNPLSFNIGDTIPASSNFVLTFSGGDGGPYNVTDTHNATPAFNLAGVTSPQTVSIDTSSLDGNTAIGLTILATATVNDTDTTTAAGDADLQYQVVDNRRIGLGVRSEQDRGVTVLNETGNMVQFDVTATNLDLSGVASTTLTFELEGTAVTPTLSSRTTNSLIASLPGTMFIPNGSYTLEVTATDTRFSGTIAPASATYRSSENRDFADIIGTEDPDGVVRRSNLDTSSERFNLSLANLDLSNADTNITSVTIDNVDIGNRYTLENDNIHISIPPDQWSTLAGTDILRVLITDNSVTRDPYSQAQQISVEVFEPFFDGTSATTPTATQIQNFAGIERNFAIGNSFPTNGTAGQNFYVVVPSRFTNFGLQPPMSPTFVVPTNVGTVNFQHADPDQGTVAYTIWLVGPYRDTTYTIVSTT